MEQPERLKTLKEFIDEHQKLLAVIGVFFALSFYFGKAELNRVSGFISFLFFAAAVVLLAEIYRAFNSKQSSWMLIVFMNIFTPLIGYVIWYFLLAYRPFWKSQTWNVILWASIIPLWYLLKRLNVQKSLAAILKRIIFRMLRRITDRVALRSRYRDTKRIIKSQASQEEKERSLEALKQLDEAFKKEQYARNEEQAVRDARIPANIIVGLFLFIGCALAADRLASLANQRLDRAYESYKVAEHSPTATPTVTPVSNPSPVLAPQPMLTPSPSSLGAASSLSTPKPRKNSLRH
jgi:MFS family permease